MNSAPSICLLSHRGGNIGHDFMAIGLEQIIRATFPGALIEHIEQHRHFEVYPSQHWLRWANRIPHGRLTAVRRFLNRPEICRRFWPQAKDLKRFDLAIAAGGPNLVRRMGQSAEMSLMFQHMYGAFMTHGVPLLDWGVGSCFPRERIPSNAAEAFSDQDQELLQQLFAHTTITTVRDALAVKLLTDLKRPTSLIPCAAIATGLLFAQYQGDAEKQILINFQRVGGNEDWGQGVDSRQWATTIQTLIRSLQRRHRVAFLCHNVTEQRLAHQLEPGLEAHLPLQWQDYARLINTAKAAVVSRIHAAIPLAGLGVPVVAVGVDSRLGALTAMGLKTCYVKEATADWLEAELEEKIRTAVQEKESLLTVREKTVADYSALLTRYLN